MEVLANLIRVERLILLDQDNAAVDEIIDGIEEGLGNLEKDIKQGAGDTSDEQPASAVLAQMRHG